MLPSSYDERDVVFKKSKKNGIATAAAPPLTPQPGKEVIPYSSSAARAVTIDGTKKERGGCEIVNTRQHTNENMIPASIATATSNMQFFQHKKSNFESTSANNNLYHHTTVEDSQRR